MSRRPDYVFILSFWDSSYRDINLFQQFSSSVPKGSTAMYSSGCQGLYFPTTPLQYVPRCLSVPLNTILGRKYSEKSLDSDSTVWMVRTGACLYLQSKVGLVYFYWMDLPDESFCIKFPASMHEVAENQDINGSTVPQVSDHATQQ